MKTFIDELDKLYSEGNLKAVEVFLTSAVDGSEEDSLEQASFLNELAGFYRGVSHFTESENAFVRSLDIFEKNDMVATPQYATVLLNMAGLFRIKGEADKSLDLFISAMIKLENAGAKESYAYISVLNNLALAWQEKGDLDKALECATVALELLRTRSENEHIDRNEHEYDHEIAASLNNLAAIRLRRGEVNAADSLASEALSIYEAVPEPDVHYAAALTTKAVISFRSGDAYAALDGFKRSLMLTRSFFGENIEFAVCKRNIADVYELLGDTSSAVAELTDACRIATALLGEDHLTVVSMREKLSHLNEDAEQTGQYEKS